MNPLLSSTAVEKLEILIEEATRSTDEGVKRFIEPAQGTLSRAVSLLTLACNARKKSASVWRLVPTALAP